MAIIQLSIFLENRLGRLFEVISILGKNNINIRALSLAEKAEYGILRIIVDNKDKAVGILKEEKFSVNETPVLAVEVEDKPGGLAEVLNHFYQNGMNIEYMYAFVEKSRDKAILVFRVEDTEKAENILKEKVKVLNEKDIKNI